MNGPPEQARWVRPEPRRSLAPAVLERAVQTAFPDSRVLDAQPLGDGFRNANFKLQLDSVPEPVVLRIFEHDPALCQKEIDLLRLLRSSVPVPEVIHAVPGGFDEIPPFALLQYVEGISLRELTRGDDHEAIAQAAHSAGTVLAAIGRVRFPNSGWLGPGPNVIAPLLEGANAGPRFVDLCLASNNLERRTSAQLRNRAHDLVWAGAPQLAALDEERRLVHCDFGKRNLLVQQSAGQWSIAAVLDWEFAVSGSPLADVGHFLRYECTSRAVMEPHFSAGFVHAGGELPQGWRQLARIVDLIALCESLTHDQLPDEVIAELTELISATVEDRDPQLS